MIKVIDKITNWSIVALVGLIPLFFLPFTSEFYDFNKNILLLIVSLLLLAMWFLKMVLEKKVTFRRTPFDLPILAIAGAFILSTLFSAPNKLETLWLVNGAGTIVALTILYFIITNNLQKQEQNRVLNAFLVSGVILSLITIYQFIGLGETFIADNSPWAFLKSKLWTPAGGLLPLVTFLVVVLVIALSQFLSRLKKRSSSANVLIFYPLFLVFILAGLVIAAFQLFQPATRPLLLPLSTAWAIAVESFKNGRTFLFGVGPTSFLDAFSQFRPLSYNLTSLWAVRFGSSSNFYFHLLTTVGLIGFLSFGYLIWKIIKTRPLSVIHYPLFLILIIFLFLPVNFLLLFVFYLLVALLASHLPAGEYHEEGKILPWAIFIPILLITLSSLFFIGRVYDAEVFFERSLNNLRQNDGANAYNNQIKMIALNPYNDVYRIYYSQTNLLLADALASKADISDQDRQDITILVQQAIQEAKTAVSLNKNKITNWENLVNIYRQLINFAEGADQWTIATLRQTINLDPQNPNLKLTLGGIYYALQNFDEAIRWFQQAVDNKVDFANGYYNLSAVYKEKGDLKKAHEAMQITLSLIPTDSQDYQKARDELEELAKQLPVEEASPSAETETLFEPEPFPSPVIEPPIELPEQSTPPARP